MNFITKMHDNLSLIANYPLNGDINIATNVTIGLKFDGALKGSSLDGNIRFLDAAGKDVPISVKIGEYNKGIIKFTPRSNLNKGSIYSIKLGNGISSIDNYTFGMEKTISLTTKVPTSVIDNKIPKTYDLIVAYPNPFNPSTTLEYYLKPDLCIRNCKHA